MQAWHDRGTSVVQASPIAGSTYGHMEAHVSQSNGNVMKDGQHVILYVDDDDDVRDSIRTVLESNGYLFIGSGVG